MKHFFMSIFTFLLLAGFAVAQGNDLLLKKGDKGLYLLHKVAPKESFFSIGRLYNTHPKSIASFNKLDIGKGLSIGQLVNIPLTDTNFTQKGNSGTPVYYKVGEKEGLMKVSSAGNDVSLANLRQWNKLSSDNVNAGTKLIVGFLLTKEMPSVTIKPSTTAAPKEEPVVVKVEEKPVVEKPQPAEEKKPEEKKPEEKPVQKTDPVLTEPVMEKPAGSESGFFKNYFEQQIKSKPASKDATVTSGIFKTTSGWVDAKYYLLMDGAQSGTIVRVTNPSNNKTIFAKVLGEMSGIRQNEGLNIRISSAAASALQISEQDKFIVNVKY